MQVARHDLGKVNPNFQAEKMKNPAFKSGGSLLKHYHSFPGAYIFCIFYFQKIFADEELVIEDKNFLAFLTFSFSNPIIRHHSSYLDFYDRFNQKIKKKQDQKVILISTQVVEAGVDIDMDLGFKNRAILDSDEQLAGRINRNASKNGCKVFLFELDSVKNVYGNDERYKRQQSDKYSEKN